MYLYRNTETMTKYKLSFKKAFENSWDLYIEDTKTNIKLKHVPIYTVGGNIKNNLFSLTYFCTVNRCEEPLTKLYNSNIFRETYSLPGSTYTLTATKDGDIDYVNHIERQNVAEITSKIIDFLITNYMKENIQQIINFKKYVFPLKDILKDLK